MTYELGMMIGAALLTALGSIATVFTQWLRRDKTESEAELTDAQSEKTRAEAMDTMYQTIAKMSSDMQELMKSQIDSFSIADKLRRDVLVLEGENQRRIVQDKQRLDTIARLTLQVESLLKSKLAMEKANIEKDKKIKELSDKIERWRADRDADRERITTLETERSELESTVEALREKLENPPEIGSENGKKDTKPVENAKITAESDKLETD